MINLVSFKSSPSLGSSYIDELFDSLGELILEMRYDVKELENQTTENIKKTHFNIFLKSQYKIIKESSPSISDSKKISNKSFSINFYLQKKSESSFSQQVESWNFYLIHAKKEQEDLISQLSSFSRAKICIFFRSILCFLTTLPLWSNYIILNETNLNKKDYFLDHELLLNSKEKNPYDIDQMNYKEKYIDVETENFFLIFKISYLADFSFLSNGNCFIHKLKQKQFNYQKIKRERFLSEGTSEENQQNEKGEGAPLRFFAQWGIEEDISKRKVPNHFKIQPKVVCLKGEIQEIKINSDKNENDKKFTEKNEEELEIEVIDSEHDISNFKQQVSIEDDNAFELITIDTELEKKLELKKHNSDFQIIGGQKNSEINEKIVEKCGSSILKVIESVKNNINQEKIDENLDSLKKFLKNFD